MSKTVSLVLTTKQPPVSYNMDAQQELDILNDAETKMADAFDSILSVVNRNRKLFNTVEMHNLKNPFCLGAISKFLECQNGFESFDSNNFMTLAELKEIFECELSQDDEFEQEE